MGKPEQQAQKLERKPSRVHFVPSHTSEQTRTSVPDPALEAASRQERMTDQQSVTQRAQHAQQEPQQAQREQQGVVQASQPEQRQLHSKRSFQQILREQLQVHPRP